MTRPALVPPIKCQGIKTKIVPEIARLVDKLPEGRWIEPFCGSGVVALNLRPARALLADTNSHLIKFYQDIQNGTLTVSSVRGFLENESKELKHGGEDYYYEVRNRFNNSPSSLDFLFLNRSCFNGVMRFNKRGKFNVPFCRKPDRFSPAYITKICNQVRTIAEVLQVTQWEFVTSDFRAVLALATESDFVYADPPYAGRHADYFNSWDDQDEDALAEALGNLPCRFILSTWHSNEFRTNHRIKSQWESKHGRFHVLTREHYYHVGATEDLRHPMVEALITNFPVSQPAGKAKVRQEDLFSEELNTVLEY